MARATRSELSQVLKAAHDHLKRAAVSASELVWVFHAPDLGIRELGKPMHPALRKFDFGPEDSLLIIAEKEDGVFQNKFMVSWKTDGENDPDRISLKEAKAVVSALDAAVQIRKQLALKELTNVVQIVGLERKSEFA
jgi:hypothetical protein